MTNAVEAKPADEPTPTPGNDEAKAADEPAEEKPKPARCRKATAA
jgi:hypothetical protein